MKSTLFFFVNFGAVLSEIVLVPSNTAVMVGEKMDMNCLTINRSAVLKWSFHNSSRTTSIIHRKGYSDRLRGQFAHFGIEINANGPVKLSTNSTRLSDAGIYTCQCEIDGKDAEYSAHLIVLGLTAVNSCIFVLSICVGIVTISICILNKRKFKAGLTEKAEDTKAESNPDDYQNVITNENPTIEGAQTATYMELTSLTQASQSVYTSIDIAGKKPTMPSDPSSVYEDMTDI